MGNSLKLQTVLFLAIVSVPVFAGDFKVEQYRDFPTRPIKNSQDKEIGRVKHGTICENTPIKISSSGRYVWHYVTNIHGVRGLAICEHINIIEISGSAIAKNWY